MVEPTVREVTKYVDVPVYEDVIRNVAVKEHVYIDKHVPKITYETKEITVEVPQVEVVQRDVEYKKIQEVIRHVDVVQRVEVPKEKINYVTKIETKRIEKDVEIDGGIVEVPVEYEVENHIIVPRYYDEEVPTVVAQKMDPVYNPVPHGVQEVVVREYNPYSVPVDIYVPKPVVRDLHTISVNERYENVTVPAPHFNALVRSANPGITDDEAHNLLIKNADGSVPMWAGMVSIIEP